MAVAGTHLDSGHADSVSSQTTASKTPGANRLQLLFVVNAFGGTPNTPTVTGCGLTWVQVATNTRFTNYRTTLFRAMGSAPTTGALTIDYGGQTQSFNRYFWDEFSIVLTTGSNGANAIVQTVYNPSSGNGSVSLAAFSNPNNATYGAIFYNTNTTALTPGSGFTELGVYLDATNGDGSEVEWKDVNDTSVDWSVSGSTFNYMAYGIEIASAPLGATIPNGYDDFGATNIVAGSAPSGWNVATSYTFRPFDNFPLIVAGAHVPNGYDDFGYTNVTQTNSPAGWRTATSYLFRPFDTFPLLYGGVVLYALCPVPIALSLDGTGNLVSTLNTNSDMDVSLAGMGNLISTLGSDFIITVSLDGLGSLLASINSNYAVMTSLDGIGNLTGDMNEDFAIAALLTGNGSLVGDMNQNYAASASLDGSGSLTGDMNQGYTIVAFLDGHGGLTGDLGQAYQINVTLSSTGNLTGAIGGDFTVASALTGQGDLRAVDLGGDFSMNPRLDGEGDLAIPDLGGDYTMVVGVDGNGGLRAILKKLPSIVEALLPNSIAGDRDVWSHFD